MLAYYEHSTGLWSLFYSFVFLDDALSTSFFGGYISIEC